MRKILFLVLLACAHTPAWALPEISLKGFGSAGAVKSDSEPYYLNEFDTYGSQTNLTQLSRLGFNLSSNLSGGWTVTTQFVAERGAQGYTSVLDWGFVSYQPMPELAVRAGRLIAPTWLFSQQLKVGYSYLWNRPPVEVYSLLTGISNLNGVSLLSHLPLGGGDLSSEFYGGAEDGKSFINNPALPTTTDIRVSDLIGMDLKYSYADIWTLHASYSQSHSSVKVNTPYPTTALGGGSYLASTVVVPLDVHFGRFFSFGGTFEKSNFLFITEFARRLIDGRDLQAASAWYATLGYHIGKITPYLSYAWQGSLSGAYNKHPDPTVTTLKLKQYSYTVGANAQVHDSVILKAEWQPAFYKYVDSRKDFRVNIASASVNFIF